MSILSTIRTWARSDVPQRAIRTFVQTFIAVYVVTDTGAQKTTVAAAAAAAASAVYNQVIRPWLDRHTAE